MAARTTLPIHTGGTMASTGMPQLQSLADPPIHMMDGAAMDYFLIELVNILRTSSIVAAARERKLEQEMEEAGLIPPQAASPQPLKTASTIRDVPEEGTKRSPHGKSFLKGDEEGLRMRLESIGSHVGANFAERLCRDRPLFSEPLDVVKFVCKDLWTSLWDKQVDNLRTNHRGVYVLQDNQFKPIARLSSWDSRADALKRAKLYVAMPAGVIKGALSRLGYQATVTPEIISLPQCTFQVKLPKGV